MLAAVRNAVREYDRNLKIEDLKPVTVLMDRTIGQERLVAQLSVGLGALALLLAATGLYGVMAYSTSRLWRDRPAHGAGRGSPPRGLDGLAGSTLWLSLFGVIIGVPAALGAAKLVEHNVVGLSTADPTVMSVAAAVLIATAMLAGFLPAAKASRIDPMTALRQE